MSVNPYTLNNLYSQGILDYAPLELCNGTNVSAMNGLQNPYLNSAMQGSLYQNHGQYGDSVELGLGAQNIGSQSNAGANAYGLEGIGAQSAAGTNAFGLEGIGTNPQSAGQAWGGFNDVQNGVSNGVNKTISFYEKTPNFIKGILAGGLIIGSCALALKRGKKPPVENRPGFFARLNPFKKKTI